MEKQNMIESALQAAQKPFIETAPNGTPIIFWPAENGEWEYEKCPELMQTPTRKSGTFEMHDTASLIKFVQKHKQEGTQIYIDADFKSGKIAVKAAINGHTANAADWFDFSAIYQPRHTAAAENWLKYNIEKMNQAQFAHFLTNNARNIVSKNPANDAAVYPTAAEVLDFALNLEYTEKPPSNRAIANKTDASISPSKAKMPDKPKNNSKCSNVSVCRLHPIKAAIHILSRHCSNSVSIKTVAHWFCGMNCNKSTQ